MIYDAPQTAAILDLYLSVVKHVFVIVQYELFRLCWVFFYFQMRMFMVDVGAGEIQVDNADLIMMMVIFFFTEL